MGILFAKASMEAAQQPIASAVATCLVIALFVALAMVGKMMESKS